QALRDGAGVTGALDVHVGAVAAGQAADLLVDVDLRGVQGEVRPALGRESELVVVEVEDDQLLGRLVRRPDGGAQADGTGAGDDHHVLELDPGPLDGVQGTGQRL